jgi:UDP-N-acetylmuramyl tripeptide synthase
VLITGTNGKTTTSRLLASMLYEAGLPFVHNREGSNLMRGIAASLIDASSAGGSLAADGPELGLFEADEAAFPAAVRALRPRVVAVTNLFRDQLDRYGEVDTVAAFWREGLSELPAGTTLVLNADDPSVAELAAHWPGPVHWFGLEDPGFASDDAGAFDARWCGLCGGSFQYEFRYYAHTGLWRCSGCGRARAVPATSAANIDIGLTKASFDVPGLGRVELPVTGLYNVANALAAIAVATTLEVPSEALLSGLGASRAAFGRQEAIQVDGRTLRLYLVKNPAGANQVLRLMSAVHGKHEVAFLLSDRLADGQDVSWVWDVDFELLTPSLTRAWAGGTRAQEASLRLRYAGWPLAQSFPDPAALVDATLSAPPSGADDISFVASYTSMLALRRELQRRGLTHAPHLD